jgi:hypothetical protein
MLLHKTRKMYYKIRVWHNNYNPIYNTKILCAREHTEKHTVQHVYEENTRYSRITPTNMLHTIDN